MPPETSTSRAPNLVLATDLDGTFLGGDEHQRAALYQVLEAQREQVTLIYVTGRDLDFVAELIDDPAIPSPDLVIGDVGTTVVHGHDLSPVIAVQDWIDCRWDDANEFVVELLAETPGIELQPIMGPRRVSYFYDPALLDDARLEPVIEAGFDVICSADQFLDVLPRGVAKGPTLLRLIDAWDLPDDRVLVAGDTLNDLSLFHTGLRGVAVGNSEPRLLDAISNLPTVFIADGPGCAGIAEAIEHFELLGPAPATRTTPTTPTSSTHEPARS